jgi:hypothetical protein
VRRMDCGTRVQSCARGAIVPIARQCGLAFLFVSRANSRRLALGRRWRTAGNESLSLSSLSFLSLFSLCCFELPAPLTHQPFVRWIHHKIYITCFVFQHSIA